MSEHYAHLVTSFRGRALPEPARLAGYAALVGYYDLPVPLPPQLWATADRHHPHSTPQWRLLTPRHHPRSPLLGNLVFALKREGVDLGVLAALFRAVPREDLVTALAQQPTGAYARRAWFLYEWLTGEELDLPPVGKVKAVDAIDPARQYGIIDGPISRRQKIRDNLPGTPSFCPLVRRTEILAGYEARRLDNIASAALGRIHPDVVSRAAAFLMLSDSRASFDIEGERPSEARVSRWGNAIRDAGTRPLDIAELFRLQERLIEDTRFVPLGLRTEGGFVGNHDRETGTPIPEHVSARPEALESLIEGMVAYGIRAGEGGVDPVVVAAAVAFGFVYVHPFEDGNGRIHRWLIHHQLATAGYNPPGIVLPVSAAMLRSLDEYRAVLESYSRPLLPLIQWRPTSTGNVEVIGDTDDFYRFFDATRHAEYLYRCVAETVDHDVPDEVRHLEAYDRFRARLQSLIDMPARTTNLLWRFLAQGEGRLSNRARENEFAALTPAEVESIEALYVEVWDS